MKREAATLINHLQPLAERLGIANSGASESHTVRHATDVYLSGVDDIIKALQQLKEIAQGTRQPRTFNAHVDHIDVFYDVSLHVLGSDAYDRKPR